MLKKISSVQKGPSWFEVGLGACLSVLLGVALGAAYMVNKPVLKVSSIPKDAPPNAVYYMEGSRDFTRSALVAQKRKEFAGGGSVSLEEGELNAFIGSISKAAAPAPAAGKPGDKAPPPPANTKTIDVGTLNARIRGGKIQFGDTVTLNAFGVSFAVIVQGTGVFTKQGSAFAFDPEALYVGGCPVLHLPFVRDWVVRNLLFAEPAPDDLAAAWSKLADVSIEGSTLRLKMP
jgi:hypothetical protein